MQIPFERVIWDAGDCAAYFKQKRPEFLRSTRWKDGFPKEIPGRPRCWRALEVTNWALTGNAMLAPDQQAA